jgi:histone deacetylase 1/2
VLKCWERFNRDYNGEEKVAGLASTSYGVDPNWYIDSGATDHITGDLEKLSVRERYNGHEQVHTASGAGMNISHIGQSNYHIPLRNFCLKNVLHIPKASKNLISAHKLTCDNGVFVEIHPYFSLIKGLVSKEVLHRGRCQGGLYPLPPNPRKQIFHAV